MKPTALILALIFCAAILQPVTGTMASPTCRGKVCNPKTCHHKKQQKEDCTPCNYTCTNNCCTIYLPEFSVTISPLVTFLKNRPFVRNDNRTELNESECFHPPEKV